MSYPLNPALYNDDVQQEPIRAGFGRGLKTAGETNEAIVALCADLTESTQMHLFKEAFPERFIEIGIAEQNLVTVASGLARAGKIPFTSSYAAFSPGRNWEQIRTTVTLNNQPVKIVGSHAGVSVGPDGATHQMLEDIAIFGAWPDTVILQPADAVSAAKLTASMIEHKGMTYMRTLRPKTPVLYPQDEEFPIGGCKVLRRSDKDCLTILATGITVREAIKAADSLAHYAMPVRVIDIYSINPLDKATLLNCLEETVEPILITVEDHFLHGGMGDFVLAALADYEKPHRIIKLGVGNIARSGKAEELLDHAGISSCRIVTRIKSLLL